MNIRKDFEPATRMWAQLDIKSIADNPDGEMELEGMASTPSTDRMGDVVDPMGATFNLPMPLLYQHNSRQPIGLVHYAKPTKKGIPFKATIARAGIAPFIDEARALIKALLIRGVSIGFRPMKDGMEPLDPKDPWGGQHYKAWEWLELSAVTIPANMEATIQTVKSLDQNALAATGDKVRSKQVRLTQEPGATGTQTQVKKESEMNIKEQITTWEAKRAAAVAAMDAIMKKAAEDGVTLDDADSEKYDELKAEVDQIDKHLTRLRAHETAMVATATAVPAVVGTSETQSLQVRRGEGVLHANKNLPKGIGMARYVKALAFSKGDHTRALEYAKQWETSTPEVTEALKAAVAAGTTTDASWAGPLVYNANLVSEFVEFLRPQTILGKITGFRRVPFNVRFPTQTSGSTVGWVGQGLAKPVSSLVFNSGSLGFAKASGIVVVTQELARFSSPSAELLVRDDLTAQMIEFLDQQFIDPGIAAVANVSPAGILNGASNVVQASAAWTSFANVKTDVVSLMGGFAANEIAMDGTMYWIMTPATALALSMILFTGGNSFAFPDINIGGGMFLGIPVIVSNSVPHSVSAGAIVALCKASEVFLADDGAVAIDVSQEASLQMDGAPTESSAAPTATSVVSLWQTNSIGIRAERVINWQRRRNYGVGYIDNMHTS